MAAQGEGKRADAIKVVNLRYTIFVRGYRAALEGRPLKLGELIYHDKWEQITFERGWAFGRECLRRGMPYPALKGKVVPKQYHNHIRQAVSSGVLI